MNDRNYRNMPPKKKSAHETKSSNSSEALLNKLEKRFHHHVGVLMEDVNTKFQQIQESFSTVPTNEDFEELKNDVKEIKLELQMVKSVVMEHSFQLNDHSSQLKQISSQLDDHASQLKQKTDKKDLEKLGTEIKFVLSNHEERLIRLERN